MSAGLLCNCTEHEHPPARTAGPGGCGRYATDQETGGRCRECGGPPVSPSVLWEWAHGRRDRYLELMREHGHIVDAEPCPACGGMDLHRHDPLDEARTIPIDVFGHDIRG